MINKNKNIKVDLSERIIKYCLYARKSMESEERQALSIDSQIKEMTAVADRVGIKIAEIKTESHSAKSSNTRPVFNQMVSDIKNGLYGGILTWAPDRLSRNAGDLGKLVDLMDQGLLTSIQTYNQSFSNTPNEKFLLMILCSQAKLENENRGVNVKRGMRALAERGLRGGLAPVGYINSKRKDQLGLILVDKERAPIIKQMFEKVAYEGWSGYDVLNWLHEINFRTRTGKPMVLSRVYETLRRPLYYGEFEYPKGSDNWHKGKHKPIIEKGLFQIAQHQISLRSFVKKSNVRSFNFLRMMHCGHCGSGITAEEKFKKLKNGDISRYIYYMCTRGKDRNCPALYVNENDLMDQMLEIIDKVEINKIGMREKLEWDIERWHRLDSFITGEPYVERSISDKEVDLRAYAKCIFKDGTFDEKREILRYINSQLIIKDKKVFLETETQ